MLRGKRSRRRCRLALVGRGKKKHDTPEVHSSSTQLHPSSNRHANRPTSGVSPPICAFVIQHIHFTYAQLWRFSIVFTHGLPLQRAPIALDAMLSPLRSLLPRQKAPAGLSIALFDWHHGVRGAPPLASNDPSDHDDDPPQEFGFTKRAAVSR